MVYAAASHPTTGDEAGHEPIGEVGEGESLTPDDDLERARARDVGRDCEEYPLGDRPAPGRGTTWRREAPQSTRQLEQDTGHVGEAACSTADLLTGAGHGQRLRGLDLGIAHGLLAPIGSRPRRLKP